MIKHKTNTNSILLGIVIALFILILAGGYYINRQLQDLDSKMLIKINSQDGSTQEVYLNQATVLMMKNMGILE